MRRIAGVLGAVTLGAVLMLGSRVGMAAPPCCGHRDCAAQIKFCVAAGGTHHGCAVGIIGHCKTGICRCTGVAGCSTNDVICSSPSGAFLNLQE